MKIKYLILVTLTVLFFGCKSGNKGGASDTTDTTGMQQDTMSMQGSMGGMSGMMGMMHQTMMHTDTMKMTGDPDYDFARMMQIHHQGGMSMAHEVIKNGKDQETVDLAKKILDEQQKDSQDLYKYTSSNKPGESSSAFMQEMKSLMQKAKENMNKDMNMSGNPDKDFAMLMSMHHQHGIDMARAELKYGRKTEIKRIAQKSVDQQEKERKQLDELKNK